MIGPVHCVIAGLKRLAACHDGLCTRVNRRPAECAMRNADLSPSELPASEAGCAAFRRALRQASGVKMKTLRFVGSLAHAGYAFGAVFVGAVALTAVGRLVPDEALSALRALIPGETPFLELVLLGWLGVALGRLTMKAEPAPAARAAGRRQRARRRQSGRKR